FFLSLFSLRLLLRVFAGHQQRVPGKATERLVGLVDIGCVRSSGPSKNEGEVGGLGEIAAGQSHHINTQGTGRTDFNTGNFLQILPCTESRPADLLAGATHGGCAARARTHGAAVDVLL
ncbi:unnamed protein product, partial [Pylaiella littoralis]